MNVTDEQTEQLMQLLRDRDTPLLPELEPYVDSDGPFGRCLLHPLVYQVPLHSPALANKLYEQKREAVQKALEQKQWNSYIYLHERPYRLEAFTRVMTQLSDTEFWDRLGDIWRDSENIWQNIDMWHALLSSDRPNREAMMDEDEHEALAEMPQMLTVYRGCVTELNEDGPSWTLDKERAIWFAKRFVRDGQTPIVATAMVNKEHIVAYFKGRGEEEIVIPHDAPILISSYEEI